MIDLLFNYPLLDTEAAGAITSLSEHLLNESVAATRFIPVEGVPSYQTAIAHWLSLPNFQITSNRIGFGVSGHHILTSILLSHTKTHQTIACDPITYNGWLNITRLTERQNFPIESDSQGMIPEALDEAALKQSIWGVFLMPSLHNPCATVMPLERRQDIVKICRKHNLWVIDDDAYRFLNPAAPQSFAHLYPEKTFWIQSLTKPLFPSVKTAFVVAPENSMALLNEALRAVGHQPSPLTLPWIVGLLSNGKMDQFIQSKQHDAIERQLLAKKILIDFDYQSMETAFHLWVTLPKGLSSASADHILRNAGVSIVPGVNYSPTAKDPEKIRVALGGERDKSRLQKGLQILADVLSPHL